MRNENCGLDREHDPHVWREDEEEHVCTGAAEHVCRLGAEFCNRVAVPGELCAFHAGEREPSHRRSTRDDRLTEYRANVRESV